MNSKNLKIILPPVSRGKIGLKIPIMRQTGVIHLPLPGATLNIRRDQTAIIAVDSRKDGIETNEIRNS